VARRRRRAGRLPQTRVRRSARPSLSSKRCTAPCVGTRRATSTADDREERSSSSKVGTSARARHEERSSRRPDALAYERAATLRDRPWGDRADLDPEVSLQKGTDFDVHAAGRRRRRCRVQCFRVRERHCRQPRPFSLEGPRARSRRTSSRHSCGSTTRSAPRYRRDRRARADTRSGIVRSLRRRSVAAGRCASWCRNAGRSVISGSRRTQREGRA